MCFAMVAVRTRFLALLVLKRPFDWLFTRQMLSWNNAFARREVAGGDRNSMSRGKFIYHEVLPRGHRRPRSTDVDRRLSVHLLSPPPLSASTVPLSNSNGPSKNSVTEVGLAGRSLCRQREKKFLCLSLHVGVKASLASKSGTAP